MVRLDLNPQAKGQTTAVCIDAKYVNKTKTMELLTNYIQPLAQDITGIGNQVTFLGLYHPQGKKATKKIGMEFLDEFLEYCDGQGIDILYVADATYLKYLTNIKKAEGYLGYCLPCSIQGYEHIRIVVGIHYITVVTSNNPNKKLDLKRTLKTFKDVLTGTYSDPGSDVGTTEVITDVPKIIEKLNELHNYDMLTIDTETTSLRFEVAEILTVGFAVSQTESFAFPVHEHYLGEDSEYVKEALVRFINQYKGKFIYHNALYDIKVLIKNLYMSNLNDYDGLDRGLEVLGNCHDSQIIAYLALNSTQKVPLNLKDLSKEYMGVYAEDVTEAIKVPLHDLLVYNAKDCLATWYVYNTYLPIVLKDEQLSTYETIMQPSIKPLIKAMMTGLPMDIDRVKAVKQELEESLNSAFSTLYTQESVKIVEQWLREMAAQKYNDKHKVARRTPEDFKDLKFNPNSSLQLRLLLYKHYEFEPFEWTDGTKCKEEPTDVPWYCKIDTKIDKGEQVWLLKQPKTNREAFDTFLNQAKVHKEDERIVTLQALMTVSEISIILTTFISAFEEASIKHNETDYYLHGNLRLGGTQCVTADTLFNTNRGVIPYTKLNIGDLVISHDGTINPIIDIFPNGKKDIYEVTTEKGLITRVSGEHPFYVNGEWIKANSLVLGSKVKVVSLKEQWKDIPDFPMYKVSTWGRVLSKFSNKLLKPTVTYKGSKNNYLRVTLSKYKGAKRVAGKQDKSMHELVLNTFSEDTHKESEVIHLNGIPWDNRLENLAYETSTDNLQDTSKVQLYKFNPKVKFMDDKIQSIIVLPSEETFGVTVKSTHSHVTDGIVTHNSGRLSSNNP